MTYHLCEADSLSTSEALVGIHAVANVYGSVTKHLANVFCNAYLKKSIDFAWEVGIQPHRIIGLHYAVESTIYNRISPIMLNVLGIVQGCL